MLVTKFYFLSTCSAWIFYFSIIILFYYVRICLYNDLFNYLSFLFKNSLEGKAYVLIIVLFPPHHLAYGKSSENI